jgi:hypothetical protein
MDCCYIEHDIRREKRKGHVLPLSGGFKRGSPLVALEFVIEEGGELFDGIKVARRLMGEHSIKAQLKEKTARNENNQ